MKKSLYAVFVILGFLLVILLALASTGRIVLKR